MTRWLLVVLLLGGCGSGCATVPSQDPLLPPAPIGGDCAAACERGRQLRAAGDPGCRWALGSLGVDHEPGTGDEASCEQVCADAVASQVIEFPTGCIAGATSCAAADSCFQ